MQYMLDTCTCVWAIRNKTPVGFSERLTRAEAAEVCISAITLSELEYGAQKSLYPEKNKAALLEFTAAIPVMPYDAVAAMRYGIIRTHLERRGEMIGPLDMLIAAHALALGATLVTNNETEFRRVPGLRVENWVI